MKRSVLIAAIALAGAACSGSSGDAVSDPKPVDPGVATVTFRVAFPARAGAVKTLLDPLADSVDINWYSLAGAPVGNVTVTRAVPSATATIPVGSYYFLATAFDVDLNALETAGTGGRLIAGENSVVMTFLDGEWTFTTPIELSNGIVLNGFYLSYLINELDARSAIDQNALSLMSVQELTWIANYGTPAEAYYATQAKTAMQFGGGFANRNLLDGGGWNVDTGCGETYFGNNPNPACQNGAPGAGVNFRVIGDLTASGGGDDATSPLLPEGTFTPSAVEAFGDTAFVDGTHLTGHLLEYSPSGTQPTPTVVTGLTSAASAPVAKAAQSTPDSIGTVTITEYRQAIVCRDGYNGTTPNGTVEYGTWDFNDYDWSTVPPTVRRDCAVDFDGGGMDYAECGQSSPPGYVGTPDLGECNWGLIPANPSDLGELCECWDSGSMTCMGSFPACGDGIVSPWEFPDQNGDGVVDLGSFYFEHYVQSGFTLDYSTYPFTATGTPVAPGALLTIQ